jgi:DNA-binding SARP family transcriptional activator
MEFEVLGPVRARANGHLIEFGERKQRLVLAVLLLEPNQLVPLERMVDLLWRGSPPNTARRIVQAHVSRLRTVLSQVDREANDVAVVRRGPGYLLSCDPQLIDAHRFRQLVERARRSANVSDKVHLLRQALGLWRGPALADAAPEEVREQLCRGLDQARLAAVEERFEAELRLGHDAELIGELTNLVARYPYRQRLACCLMLALYHAGQAAEALAVYAEIRRRLDTDLGLEPSAELRQLQVAVLRGDPVLDRPLGPAGDQVVVPAQLPADMPHFVGRAAALQRLSDHATPAHPDGATAPSVSIVTGCAGIGKTALALRWAHQVADRFGDGQLYVSLRARDTGAAVPPERALTSLLCALGVPTAQVPTDLASASALYRTKVSGRRLVVVLDDACDADQVRPLLPGSSTCAVVVTSRFRLSSLVARDGAWQLSLEPLAASEAHDLIRRVCGDDRVRAEPRAVADLASLCGYLPLALRIAATNVSSGRYRTIAEYVTRIVAGDRLEELQLAGDEGASVAAQFERSYNLLPVPAQQLFRMLAVVPAGGCPTDAVVTLSGTTAIHARHQLHQLIDANLIEQRNGRVTMLALLRCYAERMLAAQDDPEIGRQTIRRLLQWYLERTGAAAHGPDLGWLNAERTNLLALVLRAASEPALASPTVHRLAELLYTTFYGRGDWTVESPAMP